MPQPTNTPAHTIIKAIFGRGTVRVYAKDIYVCRDHRDQLRQVRRLQEVGPWVPVTTMQEDDQNFPPEGAPCAVCSGGAIIA